MKRIAFLPWFDDPREIHLLVEYMMDVEDWSTSDCERIINEPEEFTGEYNRYIGFLYDLPF